MGRVENVFAANVGIEHSVKENVYKGSLYAMAGVGVVGCAVFVFYKKRKLSNEVDTANTSLGENEKEDLNNWASLYTINLFSLFECAIKCIFEKQRDGFC